MNTSNFEDSRHIEEEISLLIHEQHDGRVFWAHVKEINSLFKNTRLHPDERKRLWDNLSMECSNMKAFQESRRYATESKSQNWFESIRHDILMAKPNDLFGFDPPDVDEMKRLSAELREAGQELSNHKTEMTFQHKQELFQLIQEIRQVQDAWWASLKEHRSQKQEDYRDRVKANKEKNIDRLRLQIEALERHETARDNLQDKMNDSSGGNWLDRAESEYMPDLEAKIDDIKESIKRLEKWIEDDEDKLRNIT
jgi:hypothetical protein